ncbi:MAG: hypothetical protein AAFV19_13485 [Pseudomonadota bacterium]
MLSRLTVLAMALMLSACAIGNEYDYRTASPALEAEGTTSVTVAVSDQRPYVLSGDKTPDFVGLQRGGYGNPFDVTTTGEQPFAAQFGSALARALSGRGFEAVSKPIAPGTPAEKVPFDTDRLLYIAMREWKSDVFASVTMHHDAEATVFKPGYTDPVTSTFRSVGAGGDAAAFSPSASGNVAVAASARKMAELLNDPAIRAALN